MSNRRDGIMLNENGSHYVKWGRASVCPCEGSSPPTPCRGIPEKKKAKIQKLRASRAIECNRGGVLCAGGAQDTGNKKSPRSIEGGQGLRGAGGARATVRVPAPGVRCIQGRH